MTKPGNSIYKIEYLDHVIKEDIPKLPKTMKKRIKTAIETRLIVDPVGLGKPLRYSFKGHRRIRVGDYRVIYRVNPKSKLVTVIYIRHKKDIYKD